MTALYGPHDPSTAPPATFLQPDRGFGYQEDVHVHVVRQRAQINARAHRDALERQIIQEMCD